MQTNDSTTASPVHPIDRVTSHAPSDPINGRSQNIPTAIPSLIHAALVAFDADRDTSRRYLLCASALLGLKRRTRVDAEIGRPAQSRGGLSVWQLNRLIDYIETHVAEKITAIDLADLIKISTGQLFRAFKISVGMTPFRYIARRRVEAACTMMRTTREPLSQVAIACGMCDQAHLCKMFRRLIGMSPSRWRLEQQAGSADKNVANDTAISLIVDCRRQAATTNATSGSFVLSTSCHDRAA
jgi:AraC family transcriptional regulator